MFDLYPALAFSYFAIEERIARICLLVSQAARAGALGAVQHGSEHPPYVLRIVFIDGERRRGGLPEEARRHREAYFPTQNPFGPHLVPSAVQSELDEQSLNVFLHSPFFVSQVPIHVSVAAALKRVAKPNSSDGFFAECEPDSSPPSRPGRNRTRSRDLANRLRRNAGPRPTPDKERPNTIY